MEESLQALGKLLTLIVQVHHVIPQPENTHRVHPPGSAPACPSFPC